MQFWVDPMFGLNPQQWYAVTLGCFGLGILLTFGWRTKEKTRVKINIDPEQTEVSRIGAKTITVAVFIVVDNGLDIDTRLSTLSLNAEIGNKVFNCKFLQFQPVKSLNTSQEVDSISVEARNVLKGWAHFQCADEVSHEKFKKFVFSGKAVGDNEQRYTFIPLNWDNVIQGNSLVKMINQERL